MMQHKRQRKPRGVHPGAHVLAWLHMQGIEDRLTVDEMAELLDVRPRIVLVWRARIGFERIIPARQRHLADLIRHTVRIDPHLTDRDLAVRLGYHRWWISHVRSEHGIPDSMARIRAEVREYLLIDPEMPAADIRDGMVADGWVLYSRLHDVVEGVRARLQSP